MFAISVDTGEVLDYHVLSKSCQKCALKKGKCTDEEFEEWLLEHECDINFTGSSPAMEAEGAVVLWGRSIERHNLRYKWMVSDGDSKAFNAVEHIYISFILARDIFSQVSLGITQQVVQLTVWYQLTISFWGIKHFFFTIFGS